MNFRTKLSLLAALTAGCACAADSHAPASRLAQGHWVKIKVEKEGIHQISLETLRQWGFDSPERVNVYGYGGTALAMERLHPEIDDLQPTMSMRTPDGRLLFYADATLRYDTRNYDGAESFTNEAGTGWRHNIYSDHACYFLSDCDTPALPTAVSAPDAPGDTPYTGHIHVDAVDSDLTAPMAMGSLYFERTFTAADPYTTHITATDRVAAETPSAPERPATFAYLAYGKAGAGDISGSEVQHTVTGEAAAMIRTHRQGEASRYSIDDWLPMRGSITFEPGESPLSGNVSLARPEAASALTYYIDRHTFIYPRLNRLPEGMPQLLMQYPSSVEGRAIVVAGATPAQHLWDVSSPAAVRELELRMQPDGSALAAMPAAYSTASPGRLVLFDSACEHPEPELIGEVEPQNIHAMPAPHMLIITTDALAAYAHRLADAHRRLQGIDVEVVTSQQAYNEFSSGTPTPMAYRRMAHMFYRRDPEKFRYILLLGPSRWDHRGIIEHTSSEQLAIYECSVPDARATTTSAFCSDAFIGCMDDFGYTHAAAAKMHVCVGRLPAATEGDAYNMVRHTIEYMENPPAAAAMRRTIAASAPADRYEHFNYCEDVNNVLENAPGGFIISRLPIMAYPTQGNDYSEANRSLRQHLDEGRGLFTYFGHSSSGTLLTGVSFYGSGMARSLSYSSAPVALLATCNAYAPDRATVGVSADMLAKCGGGAIAAIAACRSVYSHLNRQFALYVAEAYTSATPGTSTGDIYRNARNKMIAEKTNSQARFNTNCYGLCGDPAVVLSVPDAEIKLTAVNGQAPGECPAEGLSVLRLEGYVAGDDDGIIEDFNGTADIVIYNTNAKGSILIVDPQATETPEIILSNMPMATATATVQQGRWSADIFLPEFMAAGNTFAIGADAVNTEGSSAAHGYFAGLPTAARPADTAGLDTTAPHITEMYIDSPDFRDGDEVGGDFTVHARISVPATGVCVNAAPLTGASRLTLDSSSTRGNLAGYIRPDGDGFVRIEMPYSGVTSGRHSITLTASNNVGVATEHTIGFAVASQETAASMAVEERPARTQATFSLNHTMPDNADILLIIEDAAGNTVRTLNTTEWDLRDTLGAPVPDGIYSAHALVKHGLQHTCSETVEVIVLHDVQ